MVLMKKVTQQIRVANSIKLCNKMFRRVLQYIQYINEKRWKPNSPAIQANLWKDSWAESFVSHNSSIIGDLGSNCQTVKISLPSLVVSNFFNGVPCLVALTT